MINVRTRGKHEGRCEDLDANSPLRSVEAVRSEATPGLAPKPRGHQPPSTPLSPGPGVKSIFTTRDINRQMLYKVSYPQLTSRRKTFPISA